MKKLIAMISALTMLSAMTVPFSAFAEDAAATPVTLDKDTTSGSTDVTYQVEAQYTVIIPASVVLSGTETTAASVQAENVMLRKEQKVSVTLSAADNTASGETFHAKNGDSTATYTIGKGDAETGIKVGDVIAEFETKAEKQTQKLTFSKASGAVFAGTHTEKLTFTIATDAAAAPVAATGISLPETLSLEKGSTSVLTATVTPDNADGTVEWSSSDTNVVTVDANGSVTAVSAGGATITAAIGDKSASCAVTVLPDKQEVLNMLDRASMDVLFANDEVNVKMDEAYSTVMQLEAASAASASLAEIDNLTSKMQDAQNAQSAAMSFQDRIHETIARLNMDDISINDALAVVEEAQTAIKNVNSATKELDRAILKARDFINYY